jgi:hypothetical protein
MSISGLLEDYSVPDLICGPGPREGHCLLLPVTRAGRAGFETFFQGQEAVEIAADELDPDNPDALISRIEATGLYVRCHI